MSFKSISIGMLLMAGATTASAEWSFNSGPNPNAFIQTGNMTLELQCNRIRFAPAGYEDSQDIVEKQGLSIRFLKNGTTEVGAFQVGSENAAVQIVDNYPVEVSFNSQEDYGFVLDQLAANASVNLSMIDQDVSYGIFDLKGSSAAIRSLRSACDSGANQGASYKAPEGIVYCGGGAIKRQIEYVILDNPEGEWDARVTVNGEPIRAMTAYSYFGNYEPPAGFVVALLGEDRSEFLIFSEGSANWLEYGDYRYDQCN
ncbi:hypothetical protein GS646_00590 [Ruegeria sp. HKCCD4315]|uniref:hypothetical protein n=2 Tax=Ruegeria TaxID=97050 RepID=UPI0014916E2A|nr:hypothetical protein [Ruegeria sp. HKCCD4318]NOE16213.1 hypothetical protein [Ruegeria sp. HKCCD4318-2]NOG07412.1 hypothetical protein [Ruegeria sp. HKCCD4315]NOD91054.1 hypothetical protein [Ruegeria sp. HKCCD4318]NOE16251.1 hypothetical protein [Ruegeria sp. HKCCD4318-2]NOG07450.1 hypothetical protein [Ruegeria sp. HKCCD4315]